MAERRKHRRLPIRLNVSWQRIGPHGQRYYSGQTINVSTGGLLLETASSEMKKGDLVNIELSVPPTEGLLEYGGRVSSFAKILRVAPSCHLFAGNDQNTQRYGVAMRFCRMPKLQT
ncbi:MAG: PilZ domain-containing protein [Planctomycetota bacterium]